MTSGAQTSGRAKDRRARGSVDAVRRLAILALGVLALTACSRVDKTVDAATLHDGGGGSGRDASIDAAIVDASLDAGARSDASSSDASIADASMDASSTTHDAGARDAGLADAGLADAGARDAGHDAGPITTGDCISGATGTHAVRFQWTGSRPGSTAYVVYERDQLPDTSRWRVTAASTSIGYTPVFDDTYLGEGGLDLEGTTFIDVELSTVGLTSIRNVTIAIYGRSFATTTSGSFEWQTFGGTGSSPYGSIANSTPYEWYRADATSEFSPDDSGVLLRLRAGGPSDALIVNRVEICFDAS